MARIENFKEGATWGDNIACPHCGEPHPKLRFDFKKLGQHRMIACEVCDRITVDGDVAAVIEAAPKPA